MSCVIDLGHVVIYPNPVFTQKKVGKISLIGGCLFKWFFFVLPKPPGFSRLCSSSCLQWWFNGMKRKCDHGAWWKFWYSCVIAIITWYNVTMNLQHFDASLILSCFLLRILFDSSPLNLSHHQNNELERLRRNSAKIRPPYIGGRGWSDGSCGPWFPTPHPHRFGRFGTGKRFNRSRQI